MVAISLAAAFAAGFATESFGYWVLLPIPLVALAAVWILVSMVWQRPRGAGAASVTPNWVLIAAPTVFATATLSRPLGAGATLALAAAAFWTSPPKGLKLTWACAILPVVSLLIVLRWHDSKTMVKAAFFVVACLIIARAVTNSVSKASALVSLIDGAGVFTVASVALWSVGITGDPQRTGGLWNTITGGARVIFPLSNSLAATPAVAAVFLAAVIPVVVIYQRHRMPRMAAAGCAVAVLVLADSRAGLLAAVVIGACVSLIPKTFRRFTPPLLGVGLIAPFIYTQLQDMVQWTLSSFSSVAPWLLRPTLNRRDDIWSRALAHYEDRIDWFHQIFGFGVYGQTKSGAVHYYWDRQYTAVGDAEGATPHNSMLQVLFDGGAFTVGIFVVTLVWAGWVLAKSASTTVGLSMLAGLVIVSTTEAALSPGHAQPPWWLLVAVLMIAFSKEPKEEDEAPPADEASAAEDYVTSTGIITDPQNGFASPARTPTTVLPQTDADVTTPSGK